MFKHKLVRQLAILLALKLAAVFTIKSSFFDEPVIDHGEVATDKVATRILPKQP